MFFKKSAAIGVGSLVAGNILPHVSMARDVVGKPDIAVVQGGNYFDNTLKAVAELGGMETFVPKGAKVAILANPQRNNPGAFTSPEVLKAAIQMCKKAGAKEINCISWLPQENWESTGLKKVVDEEGVNLSITDRKDESLFKPMAVAKGKALKEARIMSTFFDNDVFIDMPVTKDHAGNKFTGTLKNLMGLSSPVTNRTFHKPNWTTDGNAIRHLDQCIADLNTIIKPHLCIVDATEFIITNGPFGPGKLHKPRKVVVGTDRVAVDAYCCTLWGLEAKNIVMINEAYNHQLGEMDLKKVKIKEIKI